MDHAQYILMEPEKFATDIKLLLSWIWDDWVLLKKCNFDAIEKIINADVEELSADFQKARNLPTRVFQWCSAKFLDDQEW